MKKKKAGFTLIELIVVMSILVLLSALILVSYRSGQDRYALSQATQKLVSDLRKAQNMAMAGVEIKGQYCGYGIEIDRAARPYIYRFYADKPPVGNNCQISNNKYDGNDYLTEAVQMQPRVFISSTLPATIDVFFKAPEPVTYINGDSSAGVFGTITLKIEGRDLLGAKTIKVTTAGLIQIEP